MTSEKKRAPQLADKYVLRLPPGMRDRIAESAQRHSRSMNAEITHILQNFYDKRDHNDRLIAEAVGQSPSAEQFDAAMHTLPVPALERLAELLADAVAQRLGSPVDESGSSPVAKDAKPRRRRTAGHKD